MTQPKVSVVIPVYNAQKYLDRCITSVAEQTYKNIEIILVDDGSTDNSGTMCDIWAENDSRVKVLHKKNAGAGMARNSGIKLAAGQLITFVDSDDYIDAETVEKCVYCMSEHSCDVVAFGRNVVNANGVVNRKTITSEQVLFENSDVTDKLLSSMFNYKIGFGVGVWGKMYDLSIIKNYGIEFESERECFSEDALFVLQFFSKIKKAFVLKENLYYYFETDNSLSRAYSADREKKLDFFLEKALNIAQENDLSGIVCSSIQARYQHYMMAILKRIMMSEMTKKQKITSLKYVYTSPMLRSTLTKQTLLLHKRAMRFFYQLIKIRFYTIANMVLWCKIKG